MSLIHNSIAKLFASYPIIMNNNNNVLMDSLKSRQITVSSCSGDEKVVELLEAFVPSPPALPFATK